MTNAAPLPTRSASIPTPARDAAFVVHLVSDPSLLARAHGRVEHVSTGRAAPFESPEELVRFMQETLTALAADRR